MTRTEQKLLEIARTRRVSENDMDYFEDHIEKYPSKWGNLYLWSVQVGNYQVSDSILSIGLNLNNDSEVYKVMVLSICYNRKTIINRINQDGFVFDDQSMGKIRLSIADLKYFDFAYELLGEIKLNDRKNKIYKILGNIKTAV